MDSSQTTDFFGRILNACPDLAAFFDREGHFLKINPVWIPKTGYLPQDLLGKRWDEHVPEQDKAKVQEAIGKIRQGQNSVVFKSGFVKENGEVMLLEWKTIDLGSSDSIFVHAYDWTAVKDVEIALNESREDYRLLADCVSEGVVLSEDGVILEANAAFGRMAWMEPAEVIGKNIAILVPPDHRKRLLDDMLEGADEGYEITGIRKNGDIFPLEVRTRFVEHRGKKIRVNLLRDISDKKRLIELTKLENERVLKAQENVFSALTKNTKELIAIADAEGRLKFSGIGNSEVLGYAKDENIGRALFDLVHPEDAPHQMQKFKNLLQNPGQTETTYLRIRHKNGTWRHMEVTVHNLLNEPSVRGVVCNLRDVSENIRTQERLMESERFHRALSENSLDVVFLHDGEGVIRYVSPSLRAVLGIEPSEVMGNNVYDLLNPEDAPAMRRAITQMVGGVSRRVAFEARMRHQDGNWRRLEMLTQNLSRDPVVEGFVVNCRDVTERRAAEAGLAESEARLRGVFNSTNQLLELVDLEGRLVAFNELSRSLHRDLFGIELKLGLKVEESLQDHHRSWLKTCLEKAKKEEVQYRDIMMPDLEGKEHWFDISAQPFKNDQGTLIGVCLALTLVDERKVAEARLLQAERLAAIGQVTGAIAHEMRNPLSVISALSREKADEGDEDAKRMVAQSQRLARLMEDIMEFSRRTVLKKESLSIAEMLQSSIASARTQAKKEADGVTLRWEGASDDRLVGDRMRLGQVFHNLLLNAFQALSGKGQILISCRREGPRSVMTIADDGPGMDEKDIVRIFEPFFTKKKQGNGLGLAISRKIIEDHGGTLEVSHRQPHGLVFQVVLPNFLETASVKETT
jgi:PAS domain S-box-containing protein